MLSPVNQYSKKIQRRNEMKKTVSLMLALIMIMSMSVVAFADETDVDTGSYSVNVTGTYVAGTTGGTDYSVDIAWSAMSFTYNGEKEPVWDPQNHTYSEPEKAEAHWSDGTGSITVTNHSNAVISAVPQYTQATGFEDAEMNFDTKRMYLDTAENGNVAKVGTITVTPSGSLTEAARDGVTIGTITVTIAGAAPSIPDENAFTTYSIYIGNWRTAGYDVTAVSEAYTTAYNKCTSSSATEMDKTAAMVAFANEWNKLIAAGVDGPGML